MGCGCGCCGRVRAGRGVCVKDNLCGRVVGGLLKVGPGRGGLHGLLLSADVPVEAHGQTLEPVLYLVHRTDGRDRVGGCGDSQAGKKTQNDNFGVTKYRNKDSSLGSPLHIQCILSNKEKIIILVKTSNRSWPDSVHDIQLFGCT